MARAVPPLEQRSHDTWAERRAAVLSIGRMEFGVLGARPMVLGAKPRPCLGLLIAGLLLAGLLLAALLLAALLLLLLFIDRLAVAAAARVLLARLLREPPSFCTSTCRSERRGSPPALQPRLHQQQVEPEQHPVQPARRRAEEQVAASLGLAVGGQQLERRCARHQLGG